MRDRHEVVRKPGRHWRVGFGVVSLMLLALGITIELETAAAYAFEQSIVRKYASTSGVGVSAEPKVIEHSGRVNYKSVYALKVTYSFDVQGIAREGTRCGYEGVYGRFIGRNAAQAAAERFQRSAVTVFYNSVDPSDCYMLQPHHFSEMIWPALLILLGLPGTILGGQMLLRIQHLRRAQHPVN